jgi:lysozyme
MAQDLVIDLSHWNDPVDFEEIQASGIVGIIHKATEGSSYVDDRYFERKEQALEAGLLWGAYHFMRPGDQRAHAQHFYETVGDIDVYAADHEDSGVSLDELKVWLTEMEDLTGRKPIVYSGHVIKEQLGGYDPFLAEHKLWLAQYSSSPSWPEETWPKWWLWQYTDRGENDGVGGYCDLNKYEGSAQQLADEWVGGEAEPIPPPIPPGPEPPTSEVKIIITIKVKGAKVSVVTK